MKRTRRPNPKRPSCQSSVERSIQKWFQTWFHQNLRIYTELNMVNDETSTRSGKTKAIDPGMVCYLKLYHHLPWALLLPFLWLGYNTEDVQNLVFNGFHLSHGRMGVSLSSKSLINFKTDRLISSRRCKMSNHLELCWSEMRSIQFSIVPNQDSGVVDIPCILFLLQVYIPAIPGNHSKLVKPTVTKFVAGRGRTRWSEKDHRPRLKSPNNFFGDGKHCLFVGWLVGSFVIVNIETTWRSPLFRKIAAA